MRDELCWLHLPATADERLCYKLTVHVCAINSDTWRRRCRGQVLQHRRRLSPIDPTRRPGMCTARWSIGVRQRRAVHRRQLMYLCITTSAVQPKAETWVYVGWIVVLLTLWLSVSALKNKYRLVTPSFATSSLPHQPTPPHLIGS